MAKTSGLMADLWSIALLSPLVVTARMQLMATEAVRPTAKGGREIRRMMSEKPLAFSEAAFAAQRAILDDWTKRSADMTKAGATFPFAAPAIALQAATASTRRSVRRNVRRLTKF